MKIKIRSEVYMKLRKVLLLTAATAALGSMNVISAFADAVVVE